MGERIPDASALIHKQRTSTNPPRCTVCDQLPQDCTCPYTHEKKN